VFLCSCPIFNFYDPLFSTNHLFFPPQFAFLLLNFPALCRSVSLFLSFFSLNNLSFFLLPFLPPFPQALSLYVTFFLITFYRSTPSVFLPDLEVTSFIICPPRHNVPDLIFSLKTHFSLDPTSSFTLACCHFLP